MKKIDICIDDNKIFDGPIYIAECFLDRLMGLMFKKSIGVEEGIFFTNTNRVHTSFMKFPIDVVYLNKNYEVIYKETLNPWVIGSNVKGAKHLIELNKDVSEKLKINDKIKLIRY
ncbi:MAG: DUF192 domain-containing protein [Erysipelotrichaceae bacterium]|nr:DUF192 domain-containing protein [Erysipelotrichaceae bacterium]